MAPRTPEAAVAEARREILRPSRIWLSPKGNGICLTFTREMLDVGPRYGSAIEAYDHVEAADRHDGTPPPGVPVFWRIGRYGHVAVSAGGGKVISTDIKRRGKPDLVPIGLIHDRWGAVELGWTSTLNGTRIPLTTRLRRGDHGPAVAALQRALHVTADGQFGPLTEAAVNVFKTAHGGPADGVAGPKTLKLLGLDR